MSTTKIEWTRNQDGSPGKVWNPITGCSSISEGCRNCYAKRFAYRLKGRFGYPKDDPFRITFHPERSEEPLYWKKPSRIFVCSMEDIFHDDVDGFWISAIWGTMQQCPQHTFFILTKRPERFLKLTPPLPVLENVWFGVTVCNPDELWKVETLLQILATHRWVSIEPLLSAIDFKFVRGDYKGSWLNGLDWVILGTESGPKRRPAKLEWMENIVEQCQAAGIPVFVKQVEINGKTSGDPGEWPANLRVRKMPI